MYRLYTIISLLPLVATGLLSAATVSGAQPNVILIVTDDQGYGDMACHGNPWLKTPNLDRLWSQSVRLDDYHVDPYCTPTRAALLTGRYCTRVGAWSVTQGRQLLDADEVTMAEVFASSGYRTGMFGKWHLGDAWPYAPRFRGFQEVVCHRAGGANEIGNPAVNDYFDDTYFRNGIAESFQGYCTDVFFAELLRFIDQPADQPFFAYVPTNAMHSPHWVADKYSEPYAAQGHPEKRAKFYGMIANFDESLGRLLDMLDDKNLADNTIVIFMGDNGTAQGTSDEGSEALKFNAGMRGKKGSTYEGGHRVACLVRWPDRLQAGRSVKNLTAHIDWLPTLINLCDLKSPAGVQFDGKKLTPLLDGTNTDWPERSLFIERQPDQPADATKSQPGRGQPYAVLTERWRLANNELYDIAADPGQETDVAAQHPEVVAKLKGDYSSYFADVFKDRGYTRFQLGAAEENPTRFNVRDWHPTAGHVIWRQEQLDDDALLINGFWAVNVVRGGRYSIRLARFPDDAPAAMRAVKAKLKIAGQEFSKALQPDDQSVTFELDLQQGPALLETWLTDAETGNQRGAYFVEVTRR